MNNIRTRIALLLLISFGTLAGCTATNMTPRIAVYRLGDTLQVDLDEETSARWSTTRDSLVINCENCETGYTRLVEKFAQDDRAAVYISPYERLRLTLYSNDLDTVIIVEPLLTDSAPSGPRRIVRAAPKKRTDITKKENSKKEEVKKETPVKKEEVKKEEVKKRSTTARVTAAEGVAIYKDKSKREVLKILQKGQTVPYIAREGSMISVTVDGQEGFVESEAVKLED
jgi:hypothetical protein